MGDLKTYLILVAALFIFANIGFAMSLIKKRNDIADVFWGLGFVLIAWLSFLLTESQNSRGLLVNILVTIWGLRLAVHIQSRHRGQSEDFRYKAWRDDWGKWFFVRSYLQIFMLQAMFLFMIAIPVVWVNLYPQPFGLFDFIGLSIWIIGFGFEAISDWQLRRFTHNTANKGKIIQTGLWNFSRHPNYFGEVVLWWGIFFFALSIPFGFTSIFSPILITILILFVSGIPMLEKKYENNSEFIEYKKRTNSFFPMKPRI
jgi:steroid 5-alpha reductase family enzyme